jgi:hypothetical protein
MVRLDQFPTFVVAMMVESDVLAWKVDFVDSPFSAMLHIVEPVLLRLCLWWANRILTLLPFLLEP